MIVIVDYGIGNLASVLNMFKKIGATNVCISKDYALIEKATKLILPGVGAFDAGMDNLEKSGLIPLLNKKVIEEIIELMEIKRGKVNRINLKRTFERTTKKKPAKK